MGEALRVEQTPRESIAQFLLSQIRSSHAERHDSLSEARRRHCEDMEMNLKLSRKSWEMRRMMLSIGRSEEDSFILSTARRLSPARANGLGDNFAARKSCTARNGCSDWHNKAS